MSPVGLLQSCVFTLDQAQERVLAITRCCPLCVCVATISHSQTIQAIIQSYFDSLKSYFGAVKSNPDAQPPKRTPHFYKVRWIQNGITFKDGVIRLSNGKGNVAITLQSDVKPVYVEMYFQRGSYYFSLVYKVQIPPKRETGKVVAIDMGEIHPIVSHDGEHTIIYNGRALRAIKQISTSLRHISNLKWIGVSNEVIAGIVSNE